MLNLSKFIFLLSLLSIFVCCKNKNFNKNLFQTGEQKDSIATFVKKKENSNVDSLTAIIERYKSNKDYIGVTIAYNRLGGYYLNGYNYVLASDSFTEALRYAEQATDTALILEQISNVATTYRRLGSFSDASQQLFKGLNIIEQYSLKETKEGIFLHTKMLNGIGNIYKYLDNGVEAEKYFRGSLDLDFKIDNYTGMAMNYSTLGSIYEHRNLLDSAKIMYEKALEINRKIESKKGIAICHNKLGQLYYVQNQIDTSLYHFHTAYNILEGEQDIWNRLKSSMSLGWLYINTGDLKKAYKFLSESEKIALRRKSFGHIQEIYQYMAEYYRVKKDYKEALKYQTLCLNYRDSVQSQRNEQEVSKSRIEYEKQKGEKVITKLNQENTKIKLNRKIIVISSIIIATILLFSLIVSVLLIKLQVRRNKELENTNMLKDKFFSIISHDLKTPTLSLQKSLQSLVLSLEGSNNPTLLSYCNLILKTVDSQVDLLENLLEWTRLQTGRISYSPMRINLRSVCRNILDFLDLYITSKDIKVVQNIPDNCFSFADLNIVSTILRNLISNAIKFSNRGEKIEIIINKENNMWKISVKDYGVGIKEDKLDKLFKIETKMFTYGTEGEKGSGLGLNVCKEMAALEGTTITVNSKYEQGSTFSFYLKIVE